MRKTMIILPLAGLLLCGAVSASSASQEARHARESARLDKELAGLVPGKPQNCIDLRYAGGTRSFDNGKGTLLFRVSRKLVYRNDTNGSCDGIGRDRALITRIFGSNRLCRGDIAHSADLVAGFTGGSCSMQDFVPYRRP
jgi:hypothetical protein